MLRSGMLRLAGASVCLLAAFLHSLPLTASMDQRLPRFTIPHNSMAARHAVHPFDLLFTPRIKFTVCCNAVPEGGLPAKRLGAKQPTNFAQANNRFSLSGKINLLLFVALNLHILPASLFKYSFKKIKDAMESSCRCSGSLERKEFALSHRVCAVQHG